MDREAWLKVSKKTEKTKKIKKKVTEKTVPWKKSIKILKKLTGLGSVSIL